MRRNVLSVSLAIFIYVLQNVSLIAAADYSSHHRDAGYCSIQGNCGKRSLFGKTLPCVVDQKASLPPNEDAKELVDLCGEEWSDSTVCCSSEQISTLKENLKKVDSLISSCPACQKNFRSLFCHFTCSPNQSTFVNVTGSANSIDQHKRVVTELEVFVEDQFASRLYDSCKDIKFGATNGYAMDLIGGGAKNYKQFLKFLGDEKPLLGGSPFQINFEYHEENRKSQMEFLNPDIYDCNDDHYKCSCSDCPDVCPTLDSISHKHCKVGSLPCFSFSIIVIYSVLLISYVSFIGYKNKNKKVQLLQESPFLDSTSLDLPDPTRNEVYALNNFLEKIFSKLAFYCAKYPLIVLAVTLSIAGLFSSGLVFYGALEKNPVNLWVSSGAEAYKQKEYFDKHFGPFYRTEQIYVVKEDGVLTDEIVKWWFKTELDIRSIKVDDTTFESLCFKPTPDSTCVVESMTQYFEDVLPNNWKSKLKECTDSPVNCLPSFQQPLKKELLFGGYNETDIFSAQAIVVTLLLNNHLEEGDYMDENSKVIKWENALESYLLSLKTPEGVRISFSTESSLEAELNKSTNTDARIIVFSYLVMFFYASISLGGTFNLLKTRFSLGLSGIIIVLLSVTSSAGLFSYLGLKSTLIIAEVIPFLILAIGVDNIFLITHELKVINYAYPNEPIALRISKAVGRMGPSILLSCISQFLTFTLASAVSMPAVKNFALYSACAVFFNSVLQLTSFISLLSLDQRRIDSGRLDIFPWPKMQKAIRLDEVAELFENENEHHFFDRILSWYSPIVLRKKKYVISIFLLWTALSLITLPYINFGLDQRIAIPSDSYLIGYFNDVYSYLNVGPPIYFVVKDLDLTVRKNQQKLCGRFTTCEEFSLSNILEQERKRSKASTVAEPLANWLDDFLTFLNPELDNCCRFKKTTEFDELCPPYAPSRQCRACFADKQWDYSMNGFPENSDFMKYFDIWINSPSDPCPLGGKAPYSSSISYDNETIISSTFRTSHIPLRSQKDYIAAYEESVRITEELKKSLDYKEIFAYSPFYIFFVQYSSIVKLTFTLISIALVLIFVAAIILLGSIRASLVLISTVIMILINIGGAMSIWGVSLNAVSLVNLVICVGLAVEFCTHITRAFIVSDKDMRLENVDFRAYNAITGIGGAVFGGICTTKLIGVIVLAFTKSKIFEIYYFRMWFSLVVIGSLHALVFLPVFLAAVGSKRYTFSENSTGIADDLLNRLTDSDR